MKKLILLLVIFGAIFATQAQNLRVIPADLIKSLPNGWHKFNYKGVYFDVEVANQLLVKGNIKWLDKSMYSGGFSNNEISGKGTYTWANGDKYEGSFKSNERSGKGTMYWKNGEKFSGKWKYNKKNGKGKMWDGTGALVQEGVWEQNILVKEKKGK